MKKKQPYKLGDILNDALPGPVAARMPGPALFGAWRRAVGPAIAGRAKPVGLDQAGRVVVAVAGSVWKNELKLLEPEIIAKLEQDGVRVAGLRFTEPAQPVRPPEQMAVAQTDPADPAERARLEQEIKTADPRLRRALASLGAVMAALSGPEKE